MPKQHTETIAPLECPREPLGIAPAILAKREIIKPNAWCPKADIEFDAWCDRDNPKTILPKDVCKAAAAIRPEMPVTPLWRSKCCVQLGSEVNYKFESFSRTGSFHERAAIYCLQMLKEEHRREGVFTASTGNWARALAFRARRFKIPVTAILPENTLIDVVEKIQDFGAKVVLHGTNLAEAKRQAFVLRNEMDYGTYINGYDHPHAIAAAGAIGAEILDQLPQTDAILVPIGGGGLIAGIAAIVKHLKPGVLIYGIESSKSCSFFKAMENELPYQTECGKSLAGSLAVPTVGYNAFHTARSLIDKMVLVDDDNIARAVLHLAEEEKIVVEGAGALSLSALLPKPDILKELRGKTVVCLVTGGNMNKYIFPISLERAKAVEGRIIKVTVRLRAEDTQMRLKVLSMIANVGVNIVNTYSEDACLWENDIETAYLTLVCETRDIQHACTLKRVLTQIFPDMCDFLEEPFSPIPICVCFMGRLP